MSNMNPVLKSTFDNSTIIIDQSPFSIGRAVVNSHVIAHISISRLHCTFTKSQDNNWILTDSSSNGTLVNGNLIKGCDSGTLKHGDLITLGNAGYSYKFQDNTNPILILDDPEIPKLDSSVSDEQLCKFADAVEVVLNKGEVQRAPINNSEESTSATPKEQSKAPQTENFLSESTEDELTCAICSELFVKAVTLQCSHSFCKYCIELWKKNKSDCPICRTKIVSINPTLLLDNLIAKYVDSMSDERKEQRKTAIEQRTSAEKPIEQASTSHPVFISSEDEEDDDDELNSSFDEYMDEDYDYGPTYMYDSGSYGRCYSCGRRGHWANRCPYR